LACGWEIEGAYGIALLGNKWRPLDRFFSGLSPALAADLILLCRRP
jgi:hypothetical protein